MSNTLPKNFDELLTLHGNLALEKKKREENAKDELNNSSIEFMDKFLPMLFESFPKDTLKHNDTIKVKIHSTPHVISYECIDGNDNVLKTYISADYNTEILRNSCLLAEKKEHDFHGCTLKKADCGEYSYSGFFYFSSVYVDPEAEDSSKKKLLKETSEFISSFLVPTFAKVLIERNGCCDIVNMHMYLTSFGILYRVSEDMTSMDAYDILTTQKDVQIAKFSKEVINNAASILESQHHPYMSVTRYLPNKKNSKPGYDFLEKLSFTFEPTKIR